MTDAAWARIEPVLPASGRGRRWRDHRQVINGTLWQLRTGAPWREMPEHYGPWRTAHERLRRWTADGTWDRVLEHVVVKDDAVGGVEWMFSVDSSSIRAHQQGQTPRRRPPTRVRQGPLPGPQRRRTLLRPAQQFRALATRYAKRVAYYRSQLVIATIALWLRDLQGTP